MKREDLLKVAKPILFNTEMVKAILDGRKTQTRRLVKPQPNKCTCEDCNKCDEIYFNAKCGYIRCRNCNSAIYNDSGKFCYSPYNVGDVMYVRETWAALSKTEGTVPQIYYRADDEWKETFSDFSWCIKWHPSIHMPKEAARIFLKVTDVRVERLQDITDEQAKAEGANWKIGSNVGFTEKCQRSAIDRFADLWDSTIKKSDRDKYGWDANPHVWVIEFERVALDVQSVDSGGKEF